MKYNTVLVVEDNRSLLSMLSALIKHQTSLSVEVAQSMKETLQLIKENTQRFTVAVVDLNLPDAADGQAVKAVTDAGIPVIVMTGSYSDNLRKSVIKLGIIDYVIKDNISSYYYLVGLISRLHTNRSTKVLIVDDSSSQRALLFNFFKTQLFQIETADDAVEALGMIESDDSFRIVLSDYEMPKMNGFDFTRKLRQKYPSDKLVIIGLSAHSDGQISSQFLKSGASDFLPKPIVYEELFCRVNQNLGILDKIEEINSFHHELKAAHNKLLFERGIVEDTLLNIRKAEEFNDENIRYLMSPVEKTAGDIMLSAKRPDGVLHCMLGDFTGHGLPAALSGPTVADIFYSMTMKGIVGSIIIDELNLKLVEKLPSHLFLATCFIEYNQETSSINLWNAGLPTVLHFRNKKFLKDYPSQTISLGITSDILPSQSVVEIKVEPGDHLYLYTDGIIETENEKAEAYGVEGLKSCLHDLLGKGLPLNYLIEKLQEFQFHEIQADDITIIEIFI